MIRNTYSLDYICELINKGEIMELTKSLRKIDDPFQLSQLIKRGADPNYRDSLGKNVLFYNIRDILLRKGADPWCQDVYGRTPLFYVNSDYHAELLANHLHSESAKKRLRISMPKGVAWDFRIARKLYINHQAKNGNGDTALFHNDKLTNWLLQNGADTEIKNEEGQTALFFSENTEELLEHGADVNVIDNYGNNVLFYIDTFKQVKLLVNAGIDILQRNKLEHQCIDYMSDPESINYLILLGINPSLEMISKRVFNARRLLQRTVKRWLAERRGFELM